MKRFDVMKSWMQGFEVGISTLGREDASKNEHWRAGFLSGYRSRKVKNQLLDEYLLSTGREPQAVVHLAENQAKGRDGK